MPTIPLNGTPGYRFLWQLWPSGRTGGLSYYSQYTEVLSGLGLSWTKPAAAGPVETPSYNVSVAAGKAYLDGELAVLPAGVTVAVAPLSVMPPVNGINDYYIYLNPTRVLQPVPRGDAAPTTYLNGAAVGKGAQYAECIDFGDYLSATKFYEYDGAAWEEFNPIFSAPSLPAQKGRNRSFGNDMLPTVAATNFTVGALEKRVYIEPNYPPYTNSSSKALLRGGASLELGRLSLYYYTLPLSIVATGVDETDTLTVDDDTAAVLADMVTAAGSVSNLAVKLTFTSAVFAGSPNTVSSNVTAISGNTITVAADLTENLTDAVLVIEPQNAGRFYLLDRNKSDLLDVNGVLAV
jgi:hypothetical protein